MCGYPHRFWWGYRRILLSLQQDDQQDDDDQQGAESDVHVGLITQHAAAALGA
jgi:hypothetical protein